MSTNPYSTDPDAHRYLERYPTEGDRIARLVRRLGEDGARQWARRTAAIYRSSVLNPAHFAHEGERRRRFVRAYLELKDFGRRPVGAGDVSQAPASPRRSGVRMSPTTP
jgi:hypothetical protein